MFYKKKNYITIFFSNFPNEKYEKSSYIWCKNDSVWVCVEFFLFLREWISISKFSFNKHAIYEIKNSIFLP